jgi:hypothetical protein
MPQPRLSLRFAIAALGTLAASGCSMFHHDAKPAAPPPAAVKSAPAAPPVAAAPASAPASAAGWGLVAVHLDPEAMVGHTWVFPSASPVLYGDNRFVFRRDRVEASNAKDRATGTWSVESDKLCVTLNSSAWGSACYYVTESAPGQMQIRVLPDGERVPLKIQ